MLNKIITCFVSLLLVCGIRAQVTDSLRYKYNNQTIYRYGNMFMKGTEKLAFRDIRGEFSVSVLGLASYTKARQHRTKSKIFRILSFFSGLSSVFIIANDGNRNTALSFLAGQVITGYGALKYNQLSAQSLDKALWQRNKDVLLPYQ